MRTLAIVAIALASLSLLTGLGGLSALVVSPTIRQAGTLLWLGVVIQITISAMSVVGGAAVLAKHYMISRVVLVGLPIVLIASILDIVLNPDTQFNFALFVGWFVFQILPACIVIVASRATIQERVYH